MIELIEETIAEPIKTSAAVKIVEDLIEVAKYIPGEKLKRKNLNICPCCNQLSQIVWVHGHYQCQNCKTIVVSCCEYA